MANLRDLMLDASGSVADLGILLPIAAALVLHNGLDAATVFVGVGALYLAAGLYFRVPVPVQPIKAAAAVAIARDLPVSTLAAAGVLLGAALVLLGATGASRRLGRLFAKPIVRGLQLGVGLILVLSAPHLAPPPIQRSVGVVAALVAGLLILAAVRWSGRWPMALLVLAAWLVYSFATGASNPPMRPSLWHPHLVDTFVPATLWSALILLVIPQLPLTLGNAVFALADLEREYFGPRARRVTPTSISLSCGLANLAVGVLGGMPMCHGSGGLTAHYRAGARTRRMNLMIGGVLFAVGMLLGPLAIAIMAWIPVAVLMGFLLFAGTLHALLVRDLRGLDLGVALTMGIVGALTTNLAVALLVGLVLHWIPALMRTRRETSQAVGSG